LSFEDIYQKNSRLVFNLALQYVQNYEDAQEITQDVFVAVHHSLASFNGKSSLTTWIYRITINKSLDFIKSRKRQKRFGFLSSLFFESSNEIKHDVPFFDHPGVQLEQKEALAKIFRHINELPNNQTTALILSKIEGKSQAEIAEIMNLSTKAVESLIQRAKSNLLKKLNNSEG
jgi:RNA polymerase sigma factor (sigma-70 family)